MSNTLSPLLFKMAGGLCLLLLAATAGAHGPLEEETDASRLQIPQADHVIQLLPRGDLYKPYIADPQRVGFSVQIVSLIHGDIAGAGDRRIGLKGGGRFGVFRRHPENQPELGLQLSFEAGFDGYFDLENKQDNIGWDGNFGWYVTAATHGGWSYKFSALHLSSHVGDEFVEETGRQRINYTRREIALGVSKKLSAHSRTYGEAGIGYEPGNEDLQEPGRLQAGLEYEFPRVVWDDLLGWYAAIDASSMQERDWKVDLAFQTGLFLPTGHRMHRVGIEVYRGRPPMAEFFQDTEFHITLGIWVDI